MLTTLAISIEGAILAGVCIWLAVVMVGALAFIYFAARAEQRDYENDR